MDRSFHLVDHAQNTIGQLAVIEPGAAQVFLKYKIDYCCSGQCSLEQACASVDVNAEQIRREISEASMAQSKDRVRPENWSSADLIDFIVENHHAYVRRAIPGIMQLLDKVCFAHGDENLELLNIRERFIVLADELTEHMEKEEFIVFPGIKQLESDKTEDSPLSLALHSPITRMELEHEVARDLVKQIRSLSNYYSPPVFACPTYQLAYKKLQEFDDDLMKHIHLENNILFRRIEWH